MFDVQNFEWHGSWLHNGTICQTRVIKQNFKNILKVRNVALIDHTILSLVHILTFIPVFVLSVSLRGGKNWGSFYCICVLFTSWCVFRWPTLDRVNCPVSVVGCLLPA